MNSEEVFGPLNLGQESNSKVLIIFRNDSITGPPRLGKTQLPLDNISLVEGTDKSIEYRQSAISEMSTEEFGEAKNGSNRDSYNYHDHGEFFKSHEVKRMNRRAPREVFSSEDGNKDMKSIIEELSVKYALGSNSTIHFDVVSTPVRHLP